LSCYASQPADRDLDAVHLFKEIPKDILEAARMDGATTWKEIVFVLTPMAVPGIASTVLLNVILAWNEAFWTLNLTTIDAAPLTPVHRSFSAPQGNFWAKFRRFDSGHRAHPYSRLVQPTPARPRAHLRRSEIGLLIMGKIELRGVERASAPSE
jgi:hypothetical protein